MATNIGDYDHWISSNPEVGRRVHEVVIDALEDAGIAYDQVAVRIKDRASFLAKVRNPNYPDYVDFDSAYDIIGVRIITYHSSEIPQLLDVIRDLFDIDTIIDKAAETARAGHFGYASKHVIVRAEQLGGMHMEIQLRTVLQHAWAEFEHDIRYKNSTRELNPEVHRSFTLAAGLIELADQQFDKITQIINSETEDSPADELTSAGLPAELSAILGPDYPTSKVDYYAWALDMLAAHGVTTPAELRDLMSQENIRALTQAMDYPYRPGQVRLVDDMLLYKYGRDHIRRTVHIGDNITSRPGRLGNRWQKLGQKTL